MDDKIPTFGGLPKCPDCGMGLDPAFLGHACDKAQTEDPQGLASDEVERILVTLAEKVTEHSGKIESIEKLTRRERIATAALQGITRADLTYEPSANRELIAVRIAASAVQLADALIEELDKPVEAEGEA